MPSFTTCVGCDIQKRSKNEKFYNISDLSILNNLRRLNSRKRLSELNDIPVNNKICRNCFQLSKQDNILMQRPDDTSDLSFYRNGNNSHHQCTFGCKQNDSSTLTIRIPKKILQDLLMNYKFFAHEQSRMCNEHIGISNYWPLVKQINQEVKEKDQMFVMNLMHDYYQELKSTRDPIFDMSQIDAISDDVFKSWFGYSKEQFKSICSFTLHCSDQQIAVLLCKLRTALSNEQIGFLFGVCERTIANYLNQTREELLKHLVPKYINNNKRSELIAHNTEMAKILFDISDDKACCIFDATYRLAQKSSNFAGQKQLWSEQKKMPLVKPMVGCTPDGYILYVLGPFDATHNDATILKDCFSRYSEILSSIHEGDTILVDRGFRDVLNFLREVKNLKVFCPGLGQLDTIEANASRFVTKIRWIIEQVFGRLKKKFRLFSIPAHNSTLTHDFELLLIAFALLNLFHQPILSDKRQVDIAHIMKSKLNVPNLLKSVVQTFNLSQLKSPYLELAYTRLDNEENNRLISFPQLTTDDLYKISLGPYQIRNAVSYYADHSKEDIFLVQKFNPNPHHRTASLDFSQFGISIQSPLLIKAYMNSRYRSGKHHHIFVLVETVKSGREAISEYFCTCESGARTVGCCSHVMTIIWFLGYGQYNGINLPNPEICNVSVTIPKVGIINIIGSIFTNCFF